MNSGEYMDLSEKLRKITSVLYPEHDADDLPPWMHESCEDLADEIQVRLHDCAFLDDLQARKDAGLPLTYAQTLFYAAVNLFRDGTPPESLRDLADVLEELRSLLREMEVKGTGWLAYDKYPDVEREDFTAAEWAEWEDFWDTPFSEDVKGGEPGKPSPYNVTHRAFVNRARACGFLYETEKEGLLSECPDGRLAWLSDYPSLFDRLKDSGLLKIEENQAGQPVYRWKDSGFDGVFWSERNCKFIRWRDLYSVSQTR